MHTCATNRLCQVATQLRHAELQAAILAFYTTLGFTTSLPKEVLALSARAQSGLIRGMMGWIRRMVQVTATVGSKWPSVEDLKEAWARTRAVERRGKCPQAQSIEDPQVRPLEKRQRTSEPASLTQSQA